MPSCLPRDDRRVCGNTAVIAGDPEKRETEPLRRSVLPPARIHLDCCAGRANFSIPKLVYLPRLLADCTWGGPTAIGTLSYHFPLQEITKCSFLHERKDGQIVSVLAIKYMQIARDK